MTVTRETPREGQVSPSRVMAEAEAEWICTKLPGRKSVKATKILLRFSNRASLVRNTQHCWRERPRGSFPSLSKIS